MIVGVLALQGAFHEHILNFQRAAQAEELAEHSFEFVPIRTHDQLSCCDGLVIPGGESTLMSLIAERSGMLEPLRHFVATKPVWGTCAGLIFLASEVSNARPHQKALGGLSVSVARNAFGRQLDSFTETCDFLKFAPHLENFQAVFIRAPVVSGIVGPDARKTGPELAEAEGVTLHTPPLNSEKVEILHALASGLVVAVRQGNVLGTSFHPELADDSRFHGWFLKEFIVGAR